MAKYDINTEVVWYHNHRGDNQKFLLNYDGTISAENRKWHCLGFDSIGSKLKLVGHSDRRRIIKFDIPQGFPING